MKKRVSILTLLICLFACCFAACSKNASPSTTVTYSFSLNRTEITLDAGETFALVAVCGNATVAFDTSDAAVVTVDENGKITAVGAGETFVNATANGETRSCKVTVYAPEYKLVLDKDDEITVAQNAAIEITATLLRDGVEKETKIEWSVTNAATCTLNANGSTAVFQSAAAGEYVITVSCDKGIATITVTVLDR